MRCVCCNKKIKLYEFEFDDQLSEIDVIFSTEKNKMAENKNWLDGIVGNISGGYGSIHDLGMYVIGICDKCLSEKIDDGTVAYIGNYMEPNLFKEYFLEGSKKVWRRNNNLDELA